MPLRLAAFLKKPVDVTQLGQESSCLKQFAELCHEFLDVVAVHPDVVNERH